MRKKITVNRTTNLSGPFQDVRDEISRACPAKFPIGSPNVNGDTPAMFAVLTGNLQPGGTTTAELVFPQINDDGSTCWVECGAPDDTIALTDDRCLVLACEGDVIEVEPPFGPGDCSWHTKSEHQTRAVCAIAAEDIELGSSGAINLLICAETACGAPGGSVITGTVCNTEFNDQLTGVGFGLPVGTEVIVSLRRWRDGEGCFQCFWELCGDDEGCVPQIACAQLSGILTPGGSVGAQIVEYDGDSMNWIDSGIAVTVSDPKCQTLACPEDVITVLVDCDGNVLTVAERGISNVCGVITSVDELQARLSICCGSFINVDAVNECGLYLKVGDRITATLRRCVTTSQECDSPCDLDLQFEYCALGVQALAPGNYPCPFLFTCCGEPDTALVIESVVCDGDLLTITASVDCDGNFPQVVITENISSLCDGGSVDFVFVFSPTCDATITVSGINNNPVVTAFECFWEITGFSPATCEGLPVGIEACCTYRANLVGDISAGSEGAVAVRMEGMEVATFNATNWSECDFEIDDRVMVMVDQCCVASFTGCKCNGCECEFKSLFVCVNGVTHQIGFTNVQFDVSDCCDNCEVAVLNVLLSSRTIAEDCSSVTFTIDTQVVCDGAASPIETLALEPLVCDVATCDNSILIGSEATCILELVFGNDPTCSCEPCCDPNCFVFVDYEVLVPGLNLPPWNCQGQFPTSPGTQSAGIYISIDKTEWCQGDQVTVCVGICYDGPDPINGDPNEPAVLTLQYGNLAGTFSLDSCVPLQDGDGVGNAPFSDRIEWIEGLTLPSNWLAGDQFEACCTFTALQNCSNVPAGGGPFFQVGFGQGAVLQWELSEININADCKQCSN